MWLPFNAKVWFYRKPIDFRKQIDGLVILVSDSLQKNPTSGQLFVFRNKGADRLKMLYWQDNGFWLLYRRNESSRFKFPAIGEDSLELSLQQLQWLLSGIDMVQHTPSEPLKITHFY